MLSKRKIHFLNNGDMMKQHFRKRDLISGMECSVKEVTRNWKTGYLVLQTDLVSEYGVNYENKRIWYTIVNTEKTSHNY